MLQPPLGVLKSLQQDCIHLKETTGVENLKSQTHNGLYIREFYQDRANLPNLDMDADVGGEDCTKINSSMKKLENRLIPERRYKIVSLSQPEPFEDFEP